MQQVKKHSPLQVSLPDYGRHACKIYIQSTVHIQGHVWLNAGRVYKPNGCYYFHYKKELFANQSGCLFVHWITWEVTDFDNMLRKEIAWPKEQTITLWWLLLWTFHCLTVNTYSLPSAATGKTDIYFATTCVSTIYGLW